MPLDAVAEAWIGEGELVLPEAPGEELHVLAPTRIESGFRYSLSYSVTDLKILEGHTSYDRRNSPSGRLFSCPQLREPHSPRLKAETDEMSMAVKSISGRFG